MPGPGDFRGLLSPLKGDGRRYLLSSPPSPPPFPTVVASCFTLSLYLSSLLSANGCGGRGISLSSLFSADGFGGGWWSWWFACRSSSWVLRASRGGVG